MEPTVSDCCVIVLNRDQRNYAEYVRDRVRGVGLVTSLLVLSDRPLPTEIRDLIMRGVPFACVIGSTDEAKRSTTVSLLKRIPPEGAYCQVIIFHCMSHTAKLLKSRWFYPLLYILM